MSIEPVMLSNHIIFCCLLLLLPLIFPSTRVFSNDSALRIRQPKYWSFSFSNSPSNEYSELIFFRIDWFDLLAVQRTLKSLFQHPQDYIQSYILMNSKTLDICIYQRYCVHAFSFVSVTSDTQFPFDLKQRLNAIISCLNCVYRQHDQTELEIFMFSQMPNRHSHFRRQLHLR